MQQNNNATRVTIPDFTSPNAENLDRTADDLMAGNTNRIDALQDAIDNSNRGTAAVDQPVNQNLDSTVSATSIESSSVTPTKINGLVNSILAKFPLNYPVTLVFVGCGTDAETDKITVDVAQHLTERYIGKVLLVDANPSSRMLSEGLGLAELKGIGNVICDEQPWQPLLQSAHVGGLDCLPYGNVNTSKTLRSRTQAFLTDAKTEYQFICVSAGRNESPLSKSFCTAADGIYLLVDLVQLSHHEAKIASDKLLQNNLPLVGCIALDAKQE